MSGQAGAIRLGIARALVGARPRHARRAEEGRTAHARRAREGAAQVRPQEGPQGAAVLEAVVPRRPCCGSAPTASAATPTPISPTSSSSRSVAPRRGCSGADAFVVGRDTARVGSRIEAALLSRARGRRCRASCAVGVLPTPGVAYLAQARRRRGRGHLGEPQPVDRQRREAARGRRPEAARRGRGRDRATSSRAALGEQRRRDVRRDVAAHDDRADEYVAHLVARARGPHARRAAGRRRLRERCRVRRRAARVARGSAPTSSCCTPSPTVATSTTGCGSTSPDVLARGRARAAAPTSGSRSTVTPIVSSRSTSTARSSTATRSWRRSRSTCRARDAAQRRDRGDRDVEPRPAPRARRRRHRRRRDAGRRPQRARRARRARPRARWRAVGPRDLHATSRPRATACSPACLLCDLVRALAPAAVGARRGDAAVPAGARQRSASTAHAEPRRRGRRCKREIAAVEAELGERGGCSCAASGTEPVVRVMVEAPTEAEAEASGRAAAARPSRSRSPA